MEYKEPLSRRSRKHRPHDLKPRPTIFFFSPAGPVVVLYPLLLFSTFCCPTLVLAPAQFQIKRDPKGRKREKGRKGEGRYYRDSKGPNTPRMRVQDVVRRRACSLASEFPGYFLHQRHFPTTTTSTSNTTSSPTVRIYNNHIDRSPYSRSP